MPQRGGTARRGGRSWRRTATASWSTRAPARSLSRPSTTRSSRYRQDVASAMGMSRKADHAVILRNVSTNICGSDQHMVRGRTTAPVGPDARATRSPARWSRRAPTSSSSRSATSARSRSTSPAGAVATATRAKTGVCLNVNPARAGSAYGYVDMGGWLGGQAEYVMVPFADFNLLKFPDRDQALEKIRDLTMLSDIFPTGYHGCYTAGVTTGSTVYVAGAGPVGLAAAHSAQLLGAAVVIVGDLNKERLRAGPLVRLRDRRHLRRTPRWTSRSARSSASTRSTAPSTPSASRPARTAAAGRRRRPCSTPS